MIKATEEQAREYLKNSPTPKFIFAGDMRLKIWGQPPSVDCRVVAEEHYQSLIFLANQQNPKEVKIDETMNTENLKYLLMNGREKMTNRQVADAMVEVSTLLKQIEIDKEKIESQKEAYSQLSDSYKQLKAKSDRDKEKFDRCVEDKLHARKCATEYMDELQQKESEIKQLREGNRKLEKFAFNVKGHTDNYDGQNTINAIKQSYKSLED